MLIPTSEPSEAALGRLSPSDRALLELSLRQHVPDSDVAALMRTDAGEVERRREELLAAVAYELGLGSSAEAEEALLHGWGVPAERRRTPGPASLPAVSQQRRPLLLFLLAAAIAVLALVLIVGRGGDEPQPAPQPVPSPKPAPAPSARAVPMAPVAGAPARATLRQAGSGRLQLRIEQIPAGSYSVWLYDSVADAVPVARFEGARGMVDLKLPADASSYRYLDVSREPQDGNPNHSGESILRVPVEDVSARP